MAVVVSDTSPIRALHHLGCLEVLTELFDEIYIPPGVRDELERGCPPLPSIRADEIPGSVVLSPKDMDRVRLHMEHLDPGEAEAIALAEELHVGVLIDEHDGRTMALKLGLQVTGVIGILIRAKDRQLIPNVLPLLELLRREIGFYLSDRLLDVVRQQTGEK